ncbi:hypothetical protein H6G64_31775 [Calothrix sp. FACHB-156]|nr:hypothetical protein [Calothrix membranacea FACHB-236]MBD2341527.1 hypothetical protein [Calothrix sp. FACHB-156]
MKIAMRNLCSALKKSHLGFAGTTLFVISALMPAAADSFFIVLQPNLPVFSKTYAGWSAEWWQWAFRLPTVDKDGKPIHPLSFQSTDDQQPNYDPTGQKCAIGQAPNGKVWFLGGVVNVSSTVERKCIIPENKFIFFPILNGECSKIEGNGSNVNDLRKCATQLINGVDPKSIKVTLNNKDLPFYRVQSPPFNFTLPDNNILGINNTSPKSIPICEKNAEQLNQSGANNISNHLNPRLCQSVADGYYVMLAPLPVGNYTLNFTGTIPDSNPNNPPIFKLNITYKLTINKWRYISSHARTDANSKLLTQQAF